MLHLRENSLLICDLFFSLIFYTENEDAPMKFTRRGVTEFGLMVICHVGRSPHEYLGYGCWCGLGGKGVPKDDTDRYTKGALFLTSYIYIKIVKPRFQ